MNDVVEKPRRVMIVDCGLSGTGYKHVLIARLIRLLEDENIQVVTTEDKVPEIIMELPEKKDPNAAKNKLNEMMKMNASLMLNRYDMHPLEPWCPPVEKHFLPKSMVYQKPRPIRNPKPRVTKWKKK